MTRRDALRLIGLSRDAAQEAKRAAIQAHAFAEGAHTALQDIHTRPPQKPAEPTEPEPEPKPRPDPPVRPEPPTGGETVRVSWGDGEPGEWSFDADGGFGAEEAFPGVWIHPAHHRASVVGIIVQSHGLTTVTLANCFADTGGAKVRDLEITWPDGNKVALPDFDLLPGQMASFEVGKSDGLPDPGTLHPAAAPHLIDWLGGGFSHLGHVPAFGPRNANEGGAHSGIYAAGMPYILGSSLGVYRAHQAGRGSAHRHRCWRFSREAWAEGQIEPADIEGFHGFDKTRSSDLPGFWSQGVPIMDSSGKGWNQYDSSHLGRLGNWLNFAAENGLAWDRLALRALADEVRLGWCEPSSKAEQLVEQGSAWAYSWFGCHEIIKHYPGGQGCHLMGRGFAHDLLVMVNAERAWPGRYADDLDLMARTIQHVWNERHGCIYLIPYADPLFSGTIGAWKKKVNIDDDTLPLGYYPPVARTFEASLLNYSLEQLAVHGGEPLGLHHIYTKHSSFLMDYPYELRCVGAEQYSDKDQALGTLNLLGISGDRWNKGKFVAELLAQKPLWSDNPLYSWAPSLWPSAGEVGV